MIRTRQLAYRYEKGPALQFDDIDVPQGGTLLLHGASGSGKSTWLALAAGLLSASGGDMTVADQPLAAFNGRGKGAASDAWRARTVGFLPQKLHLSSALTVAGNLAMAQWAAGQPEDQAAITAALTALGVQALAARKPSQLSGGQAQRVALARAVLLQPKVVLVDEPTASLDDDAAAATLGLLHDTARQSAATLVIATHDARVQAFFNDELGVLRIQIGRKQL